ncbi:MAG: PilZ domain-containing protein, partial [Deltaproteobacteria bacterium]|nr:PilZ domain-containing protein [Deltaproteobacteria bacterium]
MQKKREFRRFAVLGELKIRPVGGRGWMRAALTTISKGGIGVYMKGILEKGQRVVLKIAYLRKGELTAVEDISASVRWVLPLGGYRAAGLRFDSIVDKKDP